MNRIGSVGANPEIVKRFFGQDEQDEQDRLSRRESRNREAGHVNRQPVVFQSVVS